MAKIPLPFPSGGVSTSYGYAGQPPLTTPDALNVLPLEPRGGRYRGGQRAGTVRTHAALEAGQPVRGLHQVSVAPRPLLNGTLLHIGKYASQEQNQPLALYTTDAAVNTVLGTSTYIQTIPPGFTPVEIDTTSTNNYLITGIGGFKMQVFDDGSEAGHVDDKYVNTLTAYPDAADKRVAIWLSGLPTASDWRNDLFHDTIYATSRKDLLFEMVASPSDVARASGGGLFFPLWHGFEGGNPVGVVWIVAKDGWEFFYYNGSTTKQGTTTGTWALEAGVFQTFAISSVGSSIICYLNGQAVHTAAVPVSTWTGGASYRCGMGWDTNAGFSVSGYSSATIPAYVRSWSVYEKPSVAAPRTDKLAAVCGGNIFYGTPTSLTEIQTGSFGTSNPIAGASLDQRLYLTDGFQLKEVNIVYGLVNDWVAKTDLGAVPRGCTIMVTWNARIVMSGRAGDAQNIFFSRQGDARDWDDAADDEQAAVTLSASSTAGRLGSDVVMLAPFTDDKLLIGCEHGMYMMQGDPAAGGTIVTISEGFGAIGRDAYCMGPDGTLYVAATNGLFAFRPGGGIDNLAEQKYEQFFNGIDREITQVQLVYDRDRDQVWVFADDTHVVYDVLTRSFWPQQLPASNGPASSVVYDGPSSDDRYVLMGGTDGVIRRLSYDALSDDDNALGDTAINSYVYLGPVRAAGANEAKLTDLEFYLGELASGTVADNFELKYTIQAAEEAYSAIYQPDRSVTNTLAGVLFRRHRRERVRGGAITVKLYSDTLDKYWTFEELVATIQGAGIQRVS